MTRIRLRTVLPLLLLLGAAAPAQADATATLSVDCSGCLDVVDADVVLVASASTVQAIQESPCRSGIAAAVRSVSVPGTVDVSDCLEGTTALFVFEYDGWRFATTERSSAMTADSGSGSGSSSGGDESSCFGGIFLANLIYQIEDPLRAVFNSISYRCEIVDLVWTLLK